MFAVKVYTPAPAVVIPGIDEFCDDDVKPFGPVQFQVDAILAPPVSVSAFPSQIGLGFAIAVTPVGVVASIETEAVFTDGAEKQVLLAIKV